MIQQCLRIICALLISVTFAGASLATDEGTAIARIDTSRSALKESVLGGLALQLTLTQPVPYRVFTLDNPARIVLDFKEVDWIGFDTTILRKSGHFKDIRFGLYRPGWSRLVFELEAPLLVTEVEMDTSSGDGSGVLNISLLETAPENFAATTGAPASDIWRLEPVMPVFAPKQRQIGDRPLIVVLDPGHGGVDPGAVRQDYYEKELVLTFALELRAALLATGRFEVHMTRDTDVFVALTERMSIARQHNADVFISLHADTVLEGDARGITVFTLSESASEEAIAQMNESLDRADLIAGVDLSRQDDEVARVLMQLARVETQARSNLLAETVVNGIAQSVGRMRRKPHLSAAFTVLKAPDIPSILVELGFMSNVHDLRNLVNPLWRERVANGIVAALDAWAIEDAAQALLLRQ